MSTITPIPSLISTEPAIVTDSLVKSFGDKSSTIVFPVPMDLLTGFTDALRKAPGTSA